MPEKRSIKNSPRKIIILYVFITAFILIAGIRYYFKQQIEIKNDIYQDLSIISELKVNQIVNWRKERFGDAMMIFSNNYFIDEISKQINNNGKNNGDPTIRKFLGSYINFYHYKDIILFDKGYNIKLALISKNKYLGEKTRQYVDSAVKKNYPEFSNIYFCELCGEIHLDVIVPLMLNNESLGGIILRIDPDEFLYPLIQTWPTNSYSAETVMTSVIGDSVYYLNELRHKKGTALNLKYKVDSSNISLPAITAVFGKTGMYEGIDYRGVPVLTDIRKIENSPWYLLAKVDIEEIYAPVKEKAIIISILTGLVLFSVGIGFIWVWTNQKKSLRILQLEDENTRQALIKHFEYVVKNSNDILVLLDDKMNIVETNERAFDILGYSKEEILKMNASDFGPSDKIDELACYMKILQEHGEVFFESNIKLKNGSEIPVENNVHSIEIGGRVYYQSILKDISERKNAEKKLKASEAKFKSLFTNSIIGIYRTTPEGKIEDCNPALLKLLGYDSFEELTERNLEKYGYEPGYSRDFFKKKMQEKGEIIGLESSWIKKDGSAIIVKENAKAVKDSGGNIVYYEGTVEDITEKKRIEENLKISEFKYRRLHESMMDGFVYVNMDGIINECNDSYLDMLGYTFDEIKKMTYVELTPEKWHEYESTIVRDQISKRGYSDVYEKEYIRKNGEVFPVEIRSFLIRNEKGEAEGMWGIIRDITERKKAEAEIVNSEEKFSSIFHSSPYAIVLTRLDDGKIIEVNKSFEKTFGYDLSEIREKSTLELNLWINEDERNSMVTDLKNTGECINKEFRFRRKSGEIGISLFNAKLVTINNSKLILASIADISEQKKAEDKIRYLVERYHSILSKQYYGTLVVSENGAVEFANDKFCELFDFRERADEIIGMKTEEVISRILPSYADPEYALNMISDFVNKNVLQTDFEVQLKNGKTLLVDYNPIVIDGVYSGRIWQHREITDRKKIEEELKKSYELLDGVGKIAKVGGWEFDAVTLKGSWTEQVALIHDMDPNDETNAEKGISFYINESREKIEKAIQDAINIGKPYDLELEMITAKGNHKWVRTIGIPHIIDGKTVRVSGSFQDITDLKAIEVAFKESQKEKILLAELIENSSQPIGVGYADGRMGIFNNAFLNLVGYTREELKNIDWSVELTPSEWIDLEMKKLAELHEHNLPVRYEKEYIRKDGSRVPIELFVHIARDEEGNPKYYYSFITDITERKKSLELIKESENKFRSLFETMNEGVALHELVLDNQGSAVDYRILDVNPAYELHTGYSVLKAKNKTATELYGVKALPPYFDIYKKVAETGIPYHFESYFEPLNKYFEISVFSPAKNYFATIFSDVTEKILIQNALRESEEKYRLLAENATDVIWILDLESGKFKYVSPSVERLRGYNVEETMQQTAIDAMTKDSYENVQRIVPERIEKFLSGEVEFYTDEVDQQHKDGHIVHTEITSRYMMNNANGKIEVIGVSRDISERKKADEKIKKLRDHYQALIEKATDGIVLLDKNGNFKYISPTAKRIFGYNIDEDLTGNPSEYTHPDDLPMVINHLMKVLQDPNYIPTIQYRFMNKNNEWQWVESIFSNLLYDPSVESIVLNFRDITERKIAEDKIIKLSRIYSFISQINQSIVHIKDINELFDSSCRIAVEYGNFKMAWIGKIDSHSENLIPATYYGFEDGYLSDLNIRTMSLDTSEPVNQGPSGSAIREGKSFYCNDIDNDPKMSPWRDEALKRGYRSVISLPIKKSGSVIGIYSLYSDTPFFFDKEELALLQDVTNDIGFAVDAIETRKERIKAAEILKENERQLREAQDLAHLGYWKWNVKTGQVEWSDEVYRIFRLDKDKFTPHIDSILALSPWPEDNKRDKELIQRAVETRKPGFYEQKFLRPDNSIGYYSSTFQGNFNEEGELISIIGTIMDITERKNAEIALRESEFFFRESQKAANIGSYKLDFKTGLWDSSEVLDTIFGINKDFSKNIEGWLDLVFDDDKKMMKDYFNNEIIKNNNYFDKEYRVKRKSDGEIRWLLGYGVLGFDENNMLSTMIGTIQDITERKLIQEEIRKLNEELEQRVKERTQELEDKNSELNRMNRLFVGRELRMVELKEKIRELESKLK